MRGRGVGWKLSISEVSGTGSIVRCGEDVEYAQWCSGIQKRDVLFIMSTAERLKMLLQLLGESSVKSVADVVARTNGRAPLQMSSNKRRWLTKALPNHARYTAEAAISRRSLSHKLILSGSGSARGAW